MSIIYVMIKIAPYILLFVQHLFFIFNLKYLCFCKQHQCHKPDIEHVISWTQKWMVQKKTHWTKLLWYVKMIVGLMNRCERCSLTTIFNGQSLCFQNTWFLGLNKCESYYIIPLCFYIKCSIITGQQSLNLGKGHIMKWLSLTWQTYLTYKLHLTNVVASFLTPHMST